MAEYIKREAVLEWFRPYTHEDILLEPVDVISEIRGIPAADVVEVVRCKDCNFWRRYGETNKGECDGLEIYGSMKEDDFCSYGERKDNG